MQGLQLDFEMGDEPEEEWHDQVWSLSEKTQAFMAPFSTNRRFDKTLMNADSKTGMEALQREMQLVFERARQLHQDRTPPRELLVFARGDAQRMEEIGSQILILSPQWIEEALNTSRAEGAGVKIVLRAGKKPQFVPGGNGKNGWNPLPHPNQNLLQVWFDYFGPHLDQAVWEKYAEQHGAQFDRFAFIVGPARCFEEWEEPFTAHERTELLMTLGDWLRHEVQLSTTEAEQLLTPTDNRASHKGS